MSRNIHTQRYTKGLVHLYKGSGTHIKKSLVLHVCTKGLVHIQKSLVHIYEGYICTKGLVHLYKGSGTYVRRVWYICTKGLVHISST